ncbi:hypothetical protein AB1Y20_006138 [Prymnesium parvum]|uniref:Uncharacterized protein n=1 Tax=Prymnesium parvum TaxID=97485 RepID=A0AB34J4D5_PRYPA
MEIMGLEPHKSSAPKLWLQVSDIKDLLDTTDPAGINGRSGERSLDCVLAAKHPDHQYERRQQSVKDMISVSVSRPPSSGWKGLQLK